MRVFFDIEPVLGYPAGIPICTVELARALCALPQPPELVGGYATARWWDFQRLKRQVAGLGVDIPISWVPLPGRMAGRLKGVPWRLARPRLPAVDLIHVTSCLPPLWLPFAEANSILTVYDLGFLLYPESGFGAPGVSRRGDCFSRAVEEADHIISISDFTKQEMCKHLGTAPEKITVVHLASQWSGAPPCYDLADTTRVLAKYGLNEGGFFISVGTISPRKNYQMLLDSFRKFRESDNDRQLAIVGEYGWGEEGLAAKLEQGIPGVVWARGVDAAELAILYRSAIASFLVSKYEGFGIPVLESMLCGCPVVYATGSSLGEVAASAGIAVEPEDVGAAAQAFNDLALNEQLHAELVAKGHDRARIFSWERNAAETYAVYDNVAHGPGPGPGPGQ